MQRGVLLVADDGRGQRVEGRQVRDLPRLGVLDHVAVHHARALEEPVLELRLVKRRRQLVLFEVLGEQLARRGHVLLGERADPGQLRLVGELVELERARHGHARREAREADLDELFRVQRAVVVPGLGCRVYAPLWWRRGERGAADRWGTIALSLRSTGQRAMAEKCASETGRGRWRRNVLQRRAEGAPARRDRRRELRARGVHGLEDAEHVHAARDLLDEHGREALRAELFVHAQEVDLDGREALAPRAHRRGDRRDKPDQLPGLGGPHPDVPLALEARRLQRLRTAHAAAQSRRGGSSAEQ